MRRGLHRPGRAEREAARGAAARSGRVARAGELVRERRERALDESAAPSGCRQAPRPRTSAAQRTIWARPSRGRAARRAPAGPAVGDRGQPVDAGAALAGALAGKVANDAGAFRKRAGVGREGNERAGAEHVGASAAVRAASAAGDPPSEVAADEDGRDRLGGAPGAQHSSPTVVPSSISCTPGRDDGACQGDERGPGRVVAARRAEPVGAEARDQRKVSERLDVLDERRRAAEPALERERRLERRLGRPPAIALSSAVSSPVTKLSGTVAAVSSTRSRRRGARRSRARARHARPSPCLRDATIASRAPSACAASDGAVEHEVRRVPQERLVLAARGLAFGAVRDDDGRLPRCAATLRSFVPSGTPAPPRPRRAASSSAAIRSRGADGRPKRARCSCNVAARSERAPANRRGTPSGAETCSPCAAAELTPRLPASLRRALPRDARPTLRRS